MVRAERLSVGDSSIGLAIDTPLRSAETVPLDPADQHLLAGLKAGEERAYEALVAQYQQPVYNLVRRLLKDPSEASDVVQEVFLKVFRAVPRFEGRSSLKTWVYRVAVNEAYNHRRWFGRHRSHDVALEAREEGSANYTETLADHGASPFQTTLTHENQTVIEQTLQELKPVFRQAVILRDLEELSYEEIAEVLQISVGTVKSRILRGREALREKLLGRFTPESVMGWAAETAE